MDVRVDDHRHHGLAGEIHALGAGRHANVGGPPAWAIFAPSTTSVPFSITRPSPTISRAPSYAVTDCAERRSRHPGKDTNGHDRRDREHVHSAHGSLLHEAGARRFSPVGSSGSLARHSVPSPAREPLRGSRSARSIASRNSHGWLTTVLVSQPIDAPTSLTLRNLLAGGDARGEATVRNPAQLQRILAEAKRLEAKGPILATEDLDLPLAVARDQLLHDRSHVRPMLPKRPPDRPVAGGRAIIAQWRRPDPSRNFRRPPRSKEARPAGRPAKGGLDGHVSTRLRAGCAVGLGGAVGVLIAGRAWGDRRRILGWRGRRPVQGRPRPARSCASSWPTSGAVPWSPGPVCTSCGSPAAPRRRCR